MEVDAQWREKTSKLQQIFAVFWYSRAVAHNSAGRFDKAISALERVKSNAEYSAKTTLFRADIFHRMKEFERAAVNYKQFLTNHLDNISYAHDSNYLRAYASYFGAHAARKASLPFEETFSLVDVRFASTKAGQLTILEFSVP